MNYALVCEAQIQEEKEARLSPPIEQSKSEFHVNQSDIYITPSFKKKKTKEKLKKHLATKATLAQL